MKFVRAHVIVSGFVQGVSYRFYARIKARNLGLKGWIRNLDSGEVEAVFEGEEEKVKEMIEWCKKGPNFAKVEKIKVDFEEYKNEFDSFEIV
ncbi:MAG: acylphosphatase [Candidatus Aenigmatarchaeota archaeon]